MEEKLLTIQEAADELGVSTRTLRRWEDRGWLVPQRTNSNQRIYSQQAVKKFETRLQTLRYQSMQIAQAETAVKENVIEETPQPENQITRQRDNFTLPSLPSPKSMAIYTVSLGIIFIIFLLSAIGLSFPAVRNGSLGSFGDLVEQKIIAILPATDKKVQTELSASDAVLAAKEFNPRFSFAVSVPAKFSKLVTVRNNLQVDGSATISGQLTAPNVLYGLEAGSGISISLGQTPTVSNSGVLSIQGKTGDLILGEGLTIDEQTITGSQSTFKNFKVGSTTVSAGSSSETFEFEGSGSVSLSLDSSNKKLTISGAGGTEGGGWADDGTVVRLGTITDSVGIGTTSPSQKLSVDGNIALSGDIRFSSSGFTTCTALETVAGILTCGSDDASAGGTGDNWRLNNGAISPGNDTVDVLIGGISTSSAKFAFFNVAGGTPTASLSAGTNSGVYLTADGKLATMARQNLTLGDTTTTGNVIINPSGNVGVKTTNPAYELDVNGTVNMTGFRMTTGASSGYVLVSDGAGVGSWTNLDTNGTAGPWTLSGSTLFPDATTNNVLIGSTTTTDDIGKITVSGTKTGKALTVLNDTGSDQNILTASASGTTVVSLDRSGNLAIEGALSDLGGAVLDINDDLKITGNDILDSGDTTRITLGATTTLTNTTTTLSGTTTLTASSLTTFTTGALSINATGDLTLDATTDLILDADGADVLFRDGGASFATFTNSSTDLTLDIAGGQFLLADADVFNIGAVTGLAYNALSDSGTTSHGLASDDDLYIEGDLEVDGTLYLDGNFVPSGTGGVQGWWQRSNGALVPYNITDDLLLGATASSSAKFAVLNVASGTPTASISANSGDNATYLSGLGKLATTNKQNLTIGDSTTTGNVIINPSGNVGIGTTTPTSLLTVNDLAGTGGTLLSVVTTETGVVGANIRVTADSRTLQIGANSNVGPHFGSTLRGGLMFLDTNAIGPMVALGPQTNAVDLGNATYRFRTLYNTGIDNDGAITGKALGIFNETGDQNILTASASGTTVLTLDRSGNLAIEGALSDLSTSTLTINDALSVSGALTVTGVISDSDSNLILDDTVDLGSVANGINITTAGVISDNNGNLSLNDNTDITGDLDISGTLTSGTTNAFTVDATGNITTSGTTGLTFSSTGGIVLTGGLISDGTDGVDINDDLEIAGGTTLGDAAGDTVTVNAASWTFANDTNFTLTGGANGLSFDTSTLSIDANADRVGIGTTAPDSKLTVTGRTTGKALSVFNETGDQNILTASASGTTVANLDRNGNLIIEGSISDLSGTSLTVDDDLSINADDFTTTQSTFNLVNTTATTLNFAGAATALNIADAAITGTIDLGGVTADGATTINIATNGTSADTLAIGNSHASTTLSLVGGDDWSITTTGVGTFTQVNVDNLRVDGNTFSATSGDITLSAAGGNVLSSSALNFGGAAEQNYNFFASDISGVSTPDGVADLYVQDELEVDGTVRFGNLTYTFPTSQGSSYILQTNGSGTLSWIDAGTLPNSDKWDAANGAINPKIPTVYDLLLGSNATTSAKFGFINVNSGTPTASISANSGNNATYVTGTGTVATTNMQQLTLGSTTTGAINIGTDATARTITLGNTTGATALAFNSGTGSQTFTSNVVSGTTTTSGFVFDATAITTGTGAYFTSDSITQGKLVDINTAAANTLTSGTLLNIANSSSALTSGSMLASSYTGTAAFTGNLNYFDWTPGSSTTATGDLFRIHIGPNGTLTNLFNIVDDTSSVFSVNETQITSALPHQFTAAGDVAVAYDLLFTNPSASYVKSSAPLYLEAGGVFANDNLTLRTFNSGNVLFDTSTSGGVQVGAAEQIGKFQVSGAKTGKALVILNETGNQDVFTASVSGTTQFVITNGGKVGIGLGTNTAPTYKLHLKDAQAATYSAMLENTDTSSGARVLALKLGQTSTTVPTASRWVDFMIGNGQILGSIRGTNSGSSPHLAYSTTGADFAEYMTRANPSEPIDAGYLVCQLPEGGITKCSQENNTIIGAISDRAGFIGNDDQQGNSNKSLVSLVGQISVAVSTENGSINAGDSLTVSSQPGVAMKATGSGYIIGKALEPYSGSNVEKINVLIQPGWYAPTVSLTDGGDLDAFIDPANPDGTYVVKNTNGNTVTGKAAFSEAVVGDLTAGAINAQKIALNGVDILDWLNEQMQSILGANATEQNDTASIDVLSATIASQEAKLDELTTQFNSFEQLAAKTASNAAFIENIMNSPLLSASGSADIDEALTTLDEEDVTISDTLNVLGRTTLNDLGVTGNITAGILSIHGLDGEINTLGGPLKLQPLAVEAVEIMAGKVTIGTNGDITTEGTVTAEKINIVSDDASNASTGNGVMGTGTNTETIYTSAVSTDSLIYITFKKDYAPATRYWIEKQIDGTSFTIKLDKSVSQDINFNWWIIN